MQKRTQIPALTVDNHLRDSEFGPIKSLERKYTFSFIDFGNFDIFRVRLQFFEYFTTLLISQ